MEVKLVKTVLVTGGTGYIGSHTAVQLLNQGFSVVVYDNLCNSSKRVIDRIKKITGKHLEFVCGDIRDHEALRQVFNSYTINSVIHFAGLKSVSESEEDPIKYYNNNVMGSLILFEEMARYAVSTIVFSSSATVYGNPGYTQYKENMHLRPINVYGRTKLMVEDILRDLKKANPELRIALLRYFNPVGAHESGLIGEDPTGTPNNLMPYIAQVAVGKRNKLSIFGNDYATPDGTGLRDYIHVEDLASGHLMALDKLQKNAALITVNLGTGRPYSVLEMITAFEKASGQQIPYQIVARRAGDLAEYYADPSLAKDILGWMARYDIDRMCQDTWHWQKNNPEGYL
ncbi:MAG: UDP-glucose 4-epimerase GalE [Negativicutes bacterium]|nr:UDP-glucose 4-epimerase GalE [Negativicutes bacterium]